MGLENLREFHIFDKINCIAHVTSHMFKNNANVLQVVPSKLGVQVCWSDGPRHRCGTQDRFY